MLSKKMKESSIAQVASCPTLKVERILLKESGACVLMGEKGGRAVIPRDSLASMESRLSPGCVVTLQKQEGWTLPVVEAVIEVGNLEPEMIHPDDTRHLQRAIEQGEIVTHLTRRLAEPVEQIESLVLAIASAMTSHMATLRQMG